MRMGRGRAVPVPAHGMSMLKGVHAVARHATVLRGVAYADSGAEFIHGIVCVLCAS